MASDPRGSASMFSGWCATVPKRSPSTTAERCAEMALAKTRSVALVGVDGFLVDVEAAITSGVPGLHLVGLPDAALSEARDRVRAAIFNSGETWPNRHVTVSLFPASLPKRGSGFDLAISIAVLAA